MGDEKRRYAKTRQIFDYDNIIAGMGQQEIVCLDRGLLSIIRGFLATRGMWRTTYATARDDSFYNIPDSVEFDAIEHIIGEFLNDTEGEANELTCNLNDTLLALKAAVEAGSTCGCGASGVPGDGVIEPLPASGADTATETPPAGFSGTWEEYQEHKCKAATALVDDLIGTLNGLGGIAGLSAALGSGAVYAVISAAFFGSGSSFTASVLLGMIGLGLSATASVAIAISALVALVVLSVGELAYLTTLASNLNTDRDTIICDLLAADTVADAELVLSQAVDAAVDLGWSDLVVDLIDAAVMALASNTLVLNALFEDNDYVASLPAADCTGCDPCNANPVYLFYGTWDGVDTFTSERYTDATYNKERVVVRFRADTEGDLCGEVTIDSVGVTGPIYPSGPATNAWRLKSADGTIFYDSDNEPSWPQSNVAQLSVTSTKEKPYDTEEFSLTIGWTE